MARLASEVAYRMDCEDSHLGLMLIAKRCLHDALVTHADHQLLGLGQDARHDRVDARCGGMQSVALIESRLGGDAVSEEWIEQQAVLGCKLGVARLEFATVVGAEI